MVCVFVACPSLCLVGHKFYVCDGRWWSMWGTYLSMYWAHLARWKVNMVISAMHLLQMSVGQTVVGFGWCPALRTSLLPRWMAQVSRQMRLQLKFLTRVKVSLQFTINSKSCLFSFYIQSPYNGVLVCCGICIDYHNHWMLKFFLWFVMSNV